MRKICEIVRSKCTKFDQFFKFSGMRNVNPDFLFANNFGFSGIQRHHYRPWSSRIDYFENNRQNFFPHLEILTSENSQKAKNRLLSEITSSRWQEVDNRLLFSVTAIEDQDHSNIKAMIDIIKWRSVILFGANYHCLCSVKMMKK